MANTMSLTLPMCFVITRPMLYAIHYLFVLQSRNQYCAPYIISPCCRRDITTYELRKHMSIALLIHFWGVLTDSTSRTLPSGDVMTWTVATDIVRREITDACWPGGNIEWSLTRTVCLLWTWLSLWTNSRGNRNRRHPNAHVTFM